MSKFYITTPIYYVNANPHIGHAYTQIAVDTLSRYHRMLGHDTFFMTGTDEHGEKISEAAGKAGFAGREKEFVDTIVGNFKKAWDVLDIRYDHFVRTTDPSHEKMVQHFFARMMEEGDIYQGEYDGCYCTPCETFWTRTQVEGEMCPDCGRPLEKIKEKNYFFRMSKYQQWLIDHIEANPDFIMPDFRKNEVLGFLKEDLNDLCISRPKSRMSWGVELPFDKEYVVYVWYDALINYVSGPGSVDRLEELWPAEMHVIAKDILRHHAVYWPIMLKSVGMPLPKTIFAHGWWKMGEEKMSKSKGNIVDPVVLAGKYGVDPVRYFLLKAISFGMDGAFTEDSLVTVYNSDLANDIGNLLNRTLTMVEKYFDGVAPEVPPEGLDPGQIERSESLRAGTKDSMSGLRAGSMDDMLPWVRYHLLKPDPGFREVLENLVSVIGKANKYIEISAPWTYAKQGGMDNIKLILADMLEVLRLTAIVLAPFMPGTARRMWAQLGLGDDMIGDLDVRELNEGGGGPDGRRFPPGTIVSKGDPLFPRI